MYQKTPRHQELENNLRNTATILDRSFIDNLINQINKITEIAFDQARKQYDADMANIDIDIYRSIKNIIVEHSGVEIDSITLDSKFIDDFGLDSLDSVEICMMVEEEFCIEITDEDAEKLLTVRDLISYLEQRHVKAK